MTLLRCSSFFGNTTVITDDPLVSTFRNVIYTPSDNALFDHGRKVITESAYFLGPTPELRMSRYTTELSLFGVREEAPDDVYFFLGPIHSHYGHFLTSSLTRMWAYHKDKHANIKLVTYGSARETIERNSFIPELFRALSVPLDNLITFDRPVRLRKVIVPSPCFEEMNYVHRTFSRMCQRIGAQLLDQTTDKPSDVPLYLARYKLAQGVHSLKHEQEFASVLGRHGVEIAFPEELDLAQQVRLIADRRNIVGIGGSAFHTAAFAPPRKLITLNFSHNPISNQALIDRACSHDSLYLYSPDGVHEVKPAEKFHRGYYFSNPKQTAEEFLRILDPFMRIARSTPQQELAAYGAADDKATNNLSRINIALNKPTRQSSVSDFSLGLPPDKDSFGAVRGFCIGTYQFHTGLEENPWWDVDFEGLATIEEVRLFNRLDGGFERASSFMLLASDDGATWRPVLRRKSDIPFGGMDGKPYVWTAPAKLSTRFIRIMLLNETCLHLDQVVIYGTPPTDDAKIDNRGSVGRPPSRLSSLLGYRKRS
jgi:hypothetical protein